MTMMTNTNKQQRTLTWNESSHQEQTNVEASNQELKSLFKTYLDVVHVIGLGEWDSWLGQKHEASWKWSCPWRWWYRWRRRWGRRERRYTEPQSRTRTEVWGIWAKGLISMNIWPDRLHFQFGRWKTWKRGYCCSYLVVRTKVWQEVVEAVDLDTEVILTFCLSEILVPVSLSSFR